MLSAKVVLSFISAERFINPEQIATLTAVQVNVNFAFVGAERAGDKDLRLPFVIAVSYLPQVAEIVIKGEALLTGEREEVERVYRGYCNRKPIPEGVFEAVLERIAPDLILLGKTLNVPPPLPVKALFKFQGYQPAYCA